MRKPLYLLASLALVTTASSTTAQDGALWRDDKGRQMSLEFLGGGPLPPLPAARDNAEIAELFSRLCVETGGKGSAVIAASAVLGLSDKSYDMPVAKNQPPWPLVIARGDGIVVAQADKFLSNPHPQCNVTFYLVDAPDYAALESAIAANIGRPADNDADRVKKSGKPNKYFSPEWLLQPSGALIRAATVSITPIASPGMAGVQISLLENPEPRK